MNLKDIMEKLDAIAEAPVENGTSNPYPATNDDIATIKKYIDNTKGEAFIDSKDGMVKYMDVASARETGSGTPIPTIMPSDWIQRYAPDLAKALASTGSGQQVKSGPFGMKLDQGTKVDLTKLNTPTQEPVKHLPGQDTGPEEDIAKLNTLVSELEKGSGGQSGSDTGGTTDPTPSPAPSPAPATTPEKTLGQKAGIGAGIAGGGLAGAALGKKFGGAKGAVLGGLTGAALGGMGVNAMQESIAKELTESFGYEFEGEQLNEYSMDQFGKDAGDFGRGAWNGVTLGTGDNIAAGVKSAFGGGTYKDELAKQTAASKEAETRSPWLYGAGNVAGSIAVPVPGGAIAGGLIKGASGMAKVARGATALGTNLAAQAGVDKLKQVSDTKTLGYDPSKYPTTPQEIMAFQKANGLTADGKIGPKTTAVLTKMGLTPPTVAESIKSLQDKLAMIEGGQWCLEEDSDYRVWLTETNTVIDDHGNQIVDESILDSIEWDQARLDELSLGGLGKSLGRGYDAVANVGRNFMGGLAGKDATGNLIKDTEKNFAARMASPKANNKLRSAAEIARDSTNARGTANMANRAANYVGKNPGKVALGATALGVGGVAAANALGGDSSGSASKTGTTTGGGGGAGDSADTTNANNTTSPTTTPAAGGLSPEQQALIAQIKEIMSHEWGYDPAWIKATGHARVVIDKVTKADPLQTAADAKNDTGSQSASSTGTTTPTNNVDKIAQDAVKDFQKANMPSDSAKNPIGNLNASTAIPTGGLENPANQIKKESTEAELARWLKIARG
jgi:hypothetical protein